MGVDSTLDRAGQADFDCPRLAEDTTATTSGTTPTTFLEKEGQW